MLNPNTWIVVDDIAFAAQLIFVAIFYAKNKYIYSSRYIAGAVGLYQLYLISPNTKLVFGAAKHFELLRFYIDTARIPFFDRIRLNDLLLLGLMGAYLFSKWDDARKSVRTSVLLITILILVGILSSVNAVYDYDYVRLFLTVKIYTIGIIFLYAGAAIASKRQFILSDKFLDQFMILYAIGSLSLVMLAPEYRWGRYSNANFIPSPGMWMVPIVYFAKNLFLPSGKIFNRILIAIAFLATLIVPSKTIYLELIGFTCIYCFYKLFPKYLLDPKKFSAAWATGLVLISTAPLWSLAVEKSLIDIDLSLSTRQTQARNVYDTITEKGLFGILFGIGHGQWYKINTDFEEFDTGAWSQDEERESDFKAATQVPLLSVIRSCGCIGLGILILFCYRIAKSGCYYGNIAAERALMLSVTFQSVTIASQMPELGFESVAGSLLNAGFILAYPIVSSCKKSN